MKNLIYITICIIALCSCEQIIQVDIPPHESKLVLNAYILAGDTFPFAGSSQIFEYQNAITVSHSIGALGNDEVKFYDDATVHITSNGNLLEVITDAISIGEFWNWPNSSIIYGYIPTTTYEPGKTISIKAAQSGFPEQVVGTQKLPAYVPVTTEFIAGSTPRVKIKFNDPSDPNTYQISIWAYDSNRSYANYVYFYSYDPGFNPLGWDEWFIEEGVAYTNLGLLYDGAFNGKTKEFELFLDYYDPNDEVEYYIEFINIHPDMEKFLRSYFRYWNASDNPFAEPANIYHNVTGGYGTVCGGTRTVYKIK